MNLKTDEVENPAPAILWQLVTGDEDTRCPNCGSRRYVSTVQLAVTKEYETALVEVHGNADPIKRHKNRKEAREFHAKTSRKFFGPAFMVVDAVVVSQREV